MSRFFLFCFFLCIFNFFPFPSTFASDSSLKLGYESFLSKDYDGAISILKTVNLSKSHPLLDYQLWALGKSELEKKDFEGAIRHFQELIAQVPESLFAGRAKANLGRALYEKGDSVKAKDYLKAQLPSLPGDGKGEALLALSLAEIQLGEREAGISHLKESFLQYPSSPASKEVEAKLQELGVANFSAQDWMMRGDRLFEAKSFSEAAKAYEEASVGGDPKALTMKGESLYALKRNGDAATYLASAGSPGVPPEIARKALLHLGILQQKAGSPSQATVTFERVAKNFPGTVEGEEARYRMGDMAFDAGRVGEANAFFQKLADEYPHGNFRDRGMWRGGWKAYLRQDWKGALKYFSEMEKGALDTPTLGKAIYWQARVWEKQGDSQKAMAEFSRAAQSSPFSYYGFMALKRVKGSKEMSETPDIPASWRSAEMSLNTVGSSEKKGKDLGTRDLHFQKAVALYKINLGRPIPAELQAAIRESEKDPAELLKLLEASKRTEAYSIPVQFGQRYWETFKKIFPDERAADQYRTSFQYPYAFKSLVGRASGEFGVPAPLIVGLMRQESAFQPWVTSSSNAQGLMQMIPTTARARAKAIGESAGDPFDPATSIHLGTAELKALLDRFGGNWVHAISGYNAGPGRPPQWTAKNGHLEIDEYIEEIPLSETNLYVKLVLRNYWAYKTLYR